MRSPAKEKEVADFLRGGLAMVQQEPATTAGFAIQLNASTFGSLTLSPTMPAARHILRDVLLPR
jgi:hypothetical protein